MMKKTISNRIKLIILGLILVAFIAFYFLFKLNFKKPALLNYQLKRRATTMIAMIIAGFAIGGASIVFQSVINNSIVTPCILGMNSLYTVVRTLIVFVFGTGSIFFLNANLSFAINLIIMVILAYFIYGAMFKKTKYNVLYILLIGTVLSSLFGSIQSAIVRIMDSNEYDTLLTSLTASFDSINTEIIITGVILLALVTIILYKDIKMLNVITLGKEQAINLGVNYDIGKFSSELTGRFIINRPGRKAGESKRPSGLDSFSLWDLSLNYKANESFRAYFKVRNLFDKWYTDQLYLMDPDSTNWYSAPGRNYQFGVEYRF